MRSSRLNSVKTMSEECAPYTTKITPPETAQIRLVGSPASVQTTTAWLRAQGLDIKSASSNRPSRKEAGNVVRYLVAITPIKGATG